MNLYQKINEVKKAVSYVKKDADVGGKYKAVSHDAVIASVRDAMIEHGIHATAPSLLESTVVETGMATRSGAPIIRYEALYEIAFINTDDPTERDVVNIEAHANDEGDKAPGKAMSYAKKYAILKQFDIETGENDESRVEGISQKRRLADEHEDWINGMKTAIQEGSASEIIELWLSQDEGIRNTLASGAPDNHQGNWGPFRSKEKTAITKAQTTFYGVCREVADAINAMESDDEIAEALAELTGEHEKRTVWGMLEAPKQNQIKQLRKAA